MNLRPVKKTENWENKMTSSDKPFGLTMTIYSVAGTPLKREYKEFSTADQMSDWYNKNRKPSKAKSKKLDVKENENG